MRSCFEFNLADRFVGDAIAFEAHLKVVRCRLEPTHDRKDVSKRVIDSAARKRAPGDLVAIGADSASF